MNQTGSRPRERKETEALTVAWMLSLLASLVAQLATIVSWLLIRYLVMPAHDPSEQSVNLVVLLPGLMLTVAVISAVVCLFLLVFVQKIRRTPAPTAVVVGSVIACTVPIIAAIVLSLTG